MSTAAVRLKVIVVGGGICGFSTAIALRRAGHDVTIYEKYPEGGQGAGAGIVLRPNGVRILRSWGLQLESVGALKYKEGVIIDGKSLAVLKRIDADAQVSIEGKGKGEATMKTTRNDLWSLLRQEVVREVYDQGRIDLVYSKPVINYDAERPAIKHSDGSWESADLVVACDGIRSQAPAVVTGTESPAKASGFSAFRLMVHDEQLRRLVEQFGDSELLQSKLKEDAGIVWFAIEHPGKIFVWWTCRTNQVHCFDIVIPDNDKYASSEEWRARCDKEALLNDFGHWHPIFPAIIQAADDFLLWKICNRDPLQVLHKGGLCVLGDALHPMGPYRAQGGTQSIEDAGVLEVCLTGLKAKEELARRLRLLQSLRVPRYATIQMASTVKQDDPDFESNYKRVLDFSRKWHHGLDQSHLQNDAANMAWMVNYDAQLEAKKALKNSLDI
ncbi:unnamed protein product [Discula destructiva]